MTILLLVEILILLVLRKKLATYLVEGIQRLGGSRQSAVWWYAIISLPGVLSHEISHFLWAAFLGLRTGSIEMLPQLNADGGVELGSVGVEKKDPFRASLVGLAPLISGMALLPWLASFLPASPAQFNWLSLVIIYLILAISLHMTPSKRDMSSWPIIAVLSILFIGSLGLMGLKIPNTQTVTGAINSVIAQTAYGLGIAVLLALVLTAMGFIALKIVVQLERKRYA